MRRTIKQHSVAIKGGNHLEQLVARVERDEQGVQIRRLRAPPVRYTYRYGQHAAYLWGRGGRRGERLHAEDERVDTTGMGSTPRTSAAARVRIRAPSWWTLSWWTLSWWTCCMATWMLARLSTGPSATLQRSGPGRSGRWGDPSRWGRSVEIGRDRSNEIRTQSSLEVIRGHQRSSKVIRSHPRPSEAIRGHPRPSEVIKGHQRQSEAIRGHPRPSEDIRGIRGHQRPSEAIRGHPRPSEAILGHHLGHR